MLTVLLCNLASCCEWHVSRQENDWMCSVIDMHILQDKARREKLIPVRGRGGIDNV